MVFLSTQVSGLIYPPFGEHRFIESTISACIAQVQYWTNFSLDTLACCGKLYLLSKCDVHYSKGVGTQSFLANALFLHQNAIHYKNSKCHQGDAG